MAIKTDNKPIINTAPPQSQDSIPVKLYPQEIAEAMRAKAISPNLEYYFFKGRRKVSYKDILKRAQELVRKLNIRVAPSATIEGFAKNFTNSIASSKILQPVGTEEEPASTMAETPAVQGEENPASMSDTPSEKPFNPFSQSSPRSPESQQRPVPPEKPATTEHETGTGTDKTHKPDTSEYDNKKKFNEKNSTYSNPTTAKLPDAPKTNQEPRIFSQPDTKIKQDIKASQPTFAGTNTSNTNKFNVEKPKMSLTPGLNPQSGIKSPDMKFKQPLGPVATPQVSFKPGLFSTKSISYPLNSGFKNMASSAGRFFKSNFGKFLTPGNISRIGSSVIGGFGGMGVAGMAGAGAGTLGGFFAPEMLKAGGGRMLSAAANKGVSSFMNLSNGISKTSSRFSAASGSLKKSATTKRVAFGLLGLFFAASLIMSLVGGATTAESSPLGSQNQSSSGSSIGLDYSIPFRDPSVTPLDVKNQIIGTFPKSKVEYWDKIVQRSIAEGWNPAFVLTLWIEETGASQTTFARNGGGEVPVAGNFTKGHLGCAPLEDQTIDQSLDCLFKNFNQYPNDQFAQFMARYSGGPAASPFSNNPNFPGNIKHWYSILVPSGSGALKAVSGSARSSQVTTPSSCPVPNGTITCGSQITPVSGCGHCRADLGYGPHMANCVFPGVKDAIDIATTPSQDVFFPTINNRNISWRYVTEQGGTSGYIQIFAGEDTSTQDKYSLQIHHTEFGKGNHGTGKSGDYAAMSCSTCGAGHVHVQLRDDSTGQWIDAAQALCR